jgi:hypothetical protein
MPRPKGAPDKKKRVFKKRPGRKAANITDEEKKERQREASRKYAAKRKGTEGHIRPLKEDYESLNKFRLRKKLTWYQLMHMVAESLK